MWVMISLNPLVMCQVNQEIDQEEDLLAVDSVDNEISFLRPIRPPPPSFARVGDRLVTAPKTPAQPPRGVVRGPVQQTAVAGGALVHTNNMEVDGTYNFNYLTQDGQSRQEKGSPSPGIGGSIVQSGSWSYTGSDGQVYTVEFVADELGYRPVGQHLHPAHQQAQRQARLLAGHRQREEQTRTRNQERRTRGQEVRVRQQEPREREGTVRSRSDRQQTRNGRNRLR